MLTVVDTVVLLVVGSAVDDSRDEIMVSVFINQTHS